jgi:hypothetical protein
MSLALAVKLMVTSVAALADVILTLVEARIGGDPQDPVAVRVPVVGAEAEVVEEERRVVTTETVNPSCWPSTRALVAWPPL